MFRSSYELHTFISRTSSFSFAALVFDMGWNLNPDIFFGVRKMDP